jgi:drug/metabolite transporter (DMT)-like permease
MTYQSLTDEWLLPGLQAAAPGAFAVAQWGAAAARVDAMSRARTQKVRINRDGDLSVCEYSKTVGQRVREISGPAARKNGRYMIADPATRGDVGPDRHAKWLAAMAVLCVAIAWGVSFAVVKATVGEVSPARLVGWRFAVATFALFALRPRVVVELDRRTVGHGAVLGALLGIGFVLCTVGMQTTSVLISAFVVGTTVVFAPLIAWIWLRRRLTIRAAAAVLLALLGLAMITVRSFAVGPGTLLILTAAVLWAVHLVALKRWSRVGRLYGLTLAQLATSAVVALGCQVLVDDWQGFWPPMSRSAAAGIVFLGAAATGGAFVALSWAQTCLDTTTTAVILSLEPLVGAGLGVALGDPCTAPTLAGAIAVLTAAYLVAGPSGITADLRPGAERPE